MENELSQDNLNINEIDEELLRHQQVVGYYALKIARAMDMPVEDYLTLLNAAIFHDIGKIYISKSITHKESGLDDEEYQVMQTHAELGSKSAALPVSAGDRIRSIIRQHHERVDGTGYPDGLTGPEIDQLAKIIAVADSYDAMTSQRPYNKPKTPVAALEELKKSAGTQFDPEIIELFETAMGFNVPPSESQQDTTAQ